MNLTKTKKNSVSLITIVILAAAMALCCYIAPKQFNAEHYGVMSLLPSLFVFVTAIFTKRSFEPMLIAGFFGFAMLDGFGFLASWIDGLYTVMSDTSNIWTILVCGLFGSLVGILEATGGVKKFSQLATKFATNEKKSLFLTWFIGLFVFVDDYLHILAMGSTMKSVCDKNGVRRKSLAYIVLSGAATLAIMFPFSTWGAFYIGLFTPFGLDGTTGYLKSIPFMFWGWLAAIVVPLLFIFNIIPKTKAMQAPEDGIHVEAIETPSEDCTKSSIWGFIVPMVVLVGATIIINDLLWGVILALFAAVAIALITGTNTMTELVDAFNDGFKGILPILILLMIAFTLQQANTRLGMAPFIIEAITPFLNQHLLPVIVFVVLGLVSYFTGSFWGLAIVAAPIVVPLCLACDANIYLTTSAIVCATAVGSHGAVIGDVMLMIANTTEVDNVTITRSIIPYLLISFAGSAVLYLVCGFLF